ncbi:MAG: glycosyltransferase [Actinomycetota bacterium]
MERKTMANEEERLSRIERELREANGRLELALRDLRSSSERADADAARLQEYRSRARRAERRLGILGRRPALRLVLKASRITSALLRRARFGRPLERRAQQRAQRDVVASIRALRPGEEPREGPLVSIVVLTRNGSGHLRRLLPALRDRTAYRSFELIVVDNASEDDTPALLAQPWTFPIRVIRNEENASFSAGNNQGIAAARGDLVLFLNNDVEPINAGWLGSMVGAAQEDPARAAVGALLVYPRREGKGSPKDPDGLTIQHAGVGFTFAGGAPRARNLGTGEDPRDPALAATRRVPAVTAACMLVHRDRLRRAGGFTEGYVYGAEDVDLCVKLRADGGEIVLCGGAALFHHEFGTQVMLPSDVVRQNRARNWALFAERWGAPLCRSIRLDQLLGDGSWTGRTTRTIAITVTKDDPTAGWGDYYTAHELGDALTAKGWEVLYIEGHQNRWYAVQQHVDVVVVLLDRYDIRRGPSGAFTIAWVRNWTDRWIARPWFKRFDVVAASSDASAAIIREQTLHDPVTLPLASSERFRPSEPHPDLVCDYTFTGNNWGSGRAVLDRIDVRPGETFALYGRGWETVPEAAAHRRGQLEFERLPQLYASSKIVIDDTAEHSLPYGSMNSRVFEALACGTLVITNNVRGSEELFGGALPTYGSREELRAQLDRYLADDELRADTARKLRSQVLASHTYAHRAETLLTSAVAVVRLPSVAARISTPNWDVAEEWGDTHFARDLSGSLRRSGFRTSIHVRNEWDLPECQDADVVVQLRGLHDYAPKPGHLNVIWIISHPDDVDMDECERFDLVLAASEPFADELSARLGVPVLPLLQATNSDKFRPVQPDPTLRCPVLFVGGSRKQYRPAVMWAIELGVPLHVYGSNWEGLISPEHLKGSYFPNERLRELYCSADIVLNDHWPDMSKHGFISNRIFDILACGGFVVSDHVEGSQRLLGDAVPVFRSKEELAEILARYADDPEARRALAQAGMELVRREHSFDARARQLVPMLEERLRSRPSTIEDMSGATLGDRG